LLSSDEMSHRRDGTDSERAQSSEHFGRLFGPQIVSSERRLAFVEGLRRALPPWFKLMSAEFVQSPSRGQVWVLTLQDNARIEIVHVAVKSSDPFDEATCGAVAGRLLAWNKRETTSR
jgi:hypothetical protein